MERDHRAALLRYVLERQREAVVVLSPNGRVVESNASAQGLDAEITRLFERPEADARFAGFLDDLRASGEGYTLVAARAGRVYRLEGSAVDGWYVIAAREVSEEKLRDAELQQLRSRASLGLVAASLVHDLNNLLTPILITSSRLARELDGDSRANMASVIHTGAALAAGLTREVLALARPRVPMVERVTVNDAVLELKPLIERLLGPDVELVLDLDDATGDAHLDRKRLEHALLNLVVNARDALPQGGRVSISSRPIDHEGRPRLVLAVADTGLGMTHDVRTQAFDSFFTTKADAGGLGLGLTSVQRFARESGGDVLIDSEPSRGTTVRIFLERQPSDGPAPRARAARDAAPGRGEVVLVADRDERVRASIALALESEGYRVVTAGTPEGAIEIAAANALDVAIVEDRLTRRDPRGFFQRLRALHPHHRLVFMTESSIASCVPDGVLTVLPKAFSEEELLRAVRRALDGG